MSDRIVPNPRPKLYRPLVVEDHLLPGRYLRLRDSNGRTHFIATTKDNKALITSLTTGKNAWTPTGEIEVKSE